LLDFHGKYPLTALNANIGRKWRETNRESHEFRTLCNDCRWGRNLDHERRLAWSIKHIRFGGASRKGAAQTVA
jgi:hypothetical protein